MFFLETDFHDHQCFLISHSNVVLNFGLKICAGETSASPCCKPINVLYMQTNAAVLSDIPLGGNYCLSLNHSKGQDDFFLCSAVPSW